MKPERIDQVIPSFARRDAIGYHSLQVRELLRHLGFQSEIFYARAAPDAETEGQPLGRLGPGHPGRWLLYQLSIGSAAGDLVMSRPETLLVNYHNITPADLLRAWEPVVAEEVSWGRRQLRELATRTRAAIAVSRFNEAELVASGYRHTSVAPPLVDLDSFGGRADPQLSARLAARRRQGGHDLLFVGKLSPHKAQHELVEALALYRELYDPDARLHLVGGALSEAYHRALSSFAGELGLAEAVDITGSVSHEQIIAHYQAADVFVCASKHEGFCVPLVEAMHHGLPVVAFEAGAVSETLGGAGLVSPRPDPLWMAAAVQRVIKDRSHNAALRAAAAERVASLSLEHTRARLAAVLSDVVECAS